MMRVRAFELFIALALLNACGPGGEVQDSPKIELASESGGVDGANLHNATDIADRPSSLMALSFKDLLSGDYEGIARWPNGSLDGTSVYEIRDGKPVRYKWYPGGGAFNRDSSSAYLEENTIKAGLRGGVYNLILSNIEVISPTKFKGDLAVRWSGRLMPDMVFTCYKCS